MREIKSLNIVKREKLNNEKKYKKNKPNQKQELCVYIFTSIYMVI